MNSKTQAKNIFALLSLVLLAACAGTASAECYLYRGADGSEVIGRVENGVVLKERWNFTSLARVEDGLFYESPYSYNVLGHFEDNILYKERFGDNMLGYIKRGYIYKAGGGAPLGRAEGCEPDAAAALGFALLFGML